MLLLLSNAKNVVRQGFYAHELPRVREFCRKNNIYLVTSQFKVLLSETKGTYSNKGIRVPASSVKGMFFIYVSKDELLACKAALSEQVQDHHEFGQLLEYPECCIKAFCTMFSAEKTNLQNIPTNLWTNLSKREHDDVLLSHFPCSSDCIESIALAKKYCAVLKQHDLDYAETLLKRLEQNLYNQ